MNLSIQLPNLHESVQEMRGSDEKSVCLYHVQYTQYTRLYTGSMRDEVHIMVVDRI